MLQTEFVYRGSIVELKNIVKNYKNLIFFCGKKTLDRFANIVNTEIVNKNVLFYNDFSINPKKDEVQKALEQININKYEAIVALGGGSVIDFAKAFRFYQNKEIPLIALPTTAGTGSEATQFAVIYKNEIKTSLDDPKILPEYAIVDSQFVENAPRYLKACTGMDAYCQAIESFWAKRATSESKKYALEAIEICRDNIVDAVNTNSPRANEMMAKASHLSGKAINISRTTAAHALSYTITSKYGIPHGHAVALNIAGLFNKNIKNLSDKQQLLKALNIASENIFKYIESVMRKIGLEYDFFKMGILDFEEIINSVNIDRLNNNPIKLTKKDLLEIIQRR